MVMRYAHLSAWYLSAEVRLLDAPAPVQPPRTGANGDESVVGLQSRWVTTIQ